MYFFHSYQKEGELDRVWGKMDQRVGRLGPPINMYKNCQIKNRRLIQYNFNIFIFNQ